MEMALRWTRCQGDVWCKLNAVNLQHEHFDHADGVYMIWHGGKTPRVVYVGQGNIRKRLQFHRNNTKIQQYANLDLFVTWAVVPQERRNGVEVYLATHWRPLIGENHSDAAPIAVNFPW